MNFSEAFAKSLWEALQKLVSGSIWIKEPVLIGYYNSNFIQIEVGDDNVLIFINRRFKHVISFDITNPKFNPEIMDVRQLLQKWVYE